MQLNFDDRAVEDLKFYESEILYCKQCSIIVRIGIAQRRQELGAVFDHPLPVGCHKCDKACHEALTSPDLNPLSPPASDFIRGTLTGYELVGGLQRSSA